jgi:hypothetical protein
MFQGYVLVAVSLPGFVSGRSTTRYVSVGTNGTSPNCLSGTAVEPGSRLYYRETTTVSAITCEVDGTGGIRNSKPVSETVRVLPGFQVSAD